MKDTTQQPNIVLMVTHDTGRFIPAYGVKTVRTPHIDRLVQRGTVFEQAFTTAPQCCPSRASLTTGLQTHRTGVIGLVGKKYNFAFNPERPHLAARLKEVGYDTGAFGIVHEIGNLSRDPNELYYNQGFDYLYGREDGERRFGTCICEHFGNWLKQRPADSNQPFYAQIGIFETHRKYDFIPCKPDDSLGVTIPEPLIDGPATREDMAELQDYVKYMDDAVGVAIDALEEAGELDNTIFIFTTDHGIEIPRGKATLYNLGLETLLVMAGPGIPSGARYPHLHSHVDVVPTLAKRWGTIMMQSLMASVIGQRSRNNRLKRHVRIILRPKPFILSMTQCAQCVP